jgi:hypothetical protein
VKAILLFGVDVLPDDCAEKLAAFVRDGGAIIADHAPTRNQTGGPCKLPKSLFPEGGKEVAGDLKVSVKTEGKGSVALFSDDVDKAYKAAVETPKPSESDGLLKAMRDLLLAAGARSHAWSDNPEFETDVRVGRNSAMLTAINHAAEKGKAVIEVAELGFEPQYICDLVSGERISARRLGQKTVLDLELADRSARLIGLYPEAIVGYDLDLDSAAFSRGGRLKFTIRIRGEHTTPAPGQHIVEVTVSDPNGIVQPRYGGLLATTDGVLVRDVPLAVNSARGKWTVHVRTPYVK